MLRLLAFMALGVALLPDGQTRLRRSPAVDCSDDAIQAAHNAASAGATIAIGAGSCTWDASVTFTKQINLVGAGAGSTVITLGANTPLVLGVTDSSVSGFTFQSSLATDTFIQARGDGGTGRIHHNAFINTVGSNRRCIYFSGATGIPHPVYLVDHNTFSDCRVSIVADLGVDFGEREWETPADLGGFTACVYIEDNAFTYTDTGAGGNHAETDYGGCMVVRFNTLNGTGETHIHGSGGAQDPGGRQFEIYYNTYGNDGPHEYAFWVRSGSGPIFGNTYTTDYSQAQLFDIQGRAGVAGQCDGNDGTDGNVGDGDPDPLGWPCAFQPGTYAVSGEFNPAGPVTYLLRAIPLFLNRQGGSITPITWNSVADEDYIRDGRELQQETATFDGTIGTGVGVIASRPVTCTAGVYYWATDEGSWNSESAGDHASHTAASHSQGADGRLYRCTATDTWTLFYTPYAYPHPLVTP